MMQDIFFVHQLLQDFLFFTRTWLAGNFSKKLTPTPLKIKLLAPKNKLYRVKFSDFQLNRSEIVRKQGKLAVG